MNIRRIFSLLFIFIATINGSVDAEDINALQSMVDWSCIQFEIVGPCFKATPPFAGVKVRYWQPVLLTETVKRPGDTVIPGMSSVVGPALKSASQGLMSTTGVSVPLSSGSSCNADNTNNQMNEVHVYGFPFEQIFNGMVSMQCPEQTELNDGVIYLSELDSVEWRLGLMESMNPKSVMSESLGPICSVVGAAGNALNSFPVAVSGLPTNDLCMGSWGPTYPRTGFITHQSEPVGSAAASFRAVSIAGNFIQTPHVITRPLLWQADPQSDKLQPLWPHPGMCFNVGQNPLLWESGKTAINGKYIWVYWKKKECCIF